MHLSSRIKVFLPFGMSFVFHRECLQHFQLFRFSISDTSQYSICTASFWRFREDSYTQGLCRDINRHTIQHKIPKSLQLGYLYYYYEKLFFSFSTLNLSSAAYFSVAWNAGPDIILRAAITLVDQRRLFALKVLA